MAPRPSSRPIRYLPSRAGACIARRACARAHRSIKGRCTATAPPLAARGPVARVSSYATAASGLTKRRGVSGRPFIVLRSIHCPNTSRYLPMNSLVGGFEMRSVVGEELVGAADIGLGLLHHRHVEEDQRLAQMVIGAEAADRAGRDADHGAGLASQTLLP